jgi:hypothetical protein
VGGWEECGGCKAALSSAGAQSGQMYPAWVRCAGLWGSSLLFCNPSDDSPLQRAPLEHLTWTRPSSFSMPPSRLRQPAPLLFAATCPPPTNLSRPPASPHPTPPPAAPPGCGGAQVPDPAPPQVHGEPGGAPHPAQLGQGATRLQKGWCDRAPGWGWGWRACGWVVWGCVV